MQQFINYPRKYDKCSYKLPQEIRQMQVNIHYPSKQNKITPNDYTHFLTQKPKYSQKSIKFLQQQTNLPREPSKLVDSQVK